MISEAVLKVLSGYVGEKNVRLQEPLKDYTTFRIGGPADCMVFVESVEQLLQVQHYLQILECPFVLLGNGSNLLVSDEGYRGVVIKFGEDMCKVTVEGNRVIAQAGARLAQVAKVAKDHGLGGLEFAAGIPGTVGGGVVMNAGAYGGEMAQVVSTVTVVSSQGELLELDNETMEFGYRTSTIKNHPFLVTEVVFSLQQKDPVEIAEKMENFATQRREKQPLEYPSAGSTFKRPEGYFAGALIMEAGLRGVQIGGARVSDKHCGFLINTGNATAADVKCLICHVQKQVQERFHVQLEPEVLFLGHFESAEGKR